MNAAGSSDVRDADDPALGGIGHLLVPLLLEEAGSRADAGDEHERGAGDGADGEQRDPLQQAVELGGQQPRPLELEPPVLSSVTPAGKVPSGLRTMNGYVPLEGVAIDGGDVAPVDEVESGSERLQRDRCECRVLVVERGIAVVEAVAILVLDLDLREVALERLTEAQRHANRRPLAASRCCRGWR